MQEERRRILDLLAEDRITVEQAEALLKALNGAESAATSVPQPPVPAAVPRSRFAARSLQILITGQNGDRRVNVTVPVGLIKFAGKFLPPGAQLKIEESGIDLQALLNSLNDPDGIAPGTTLLSIEADGDGDGDIITIKAV